MKKTEMSPTLRKELREYLSRLESYIKGPFDPKISMLIDCVRTLIEEGGK